MSVGLGGLGVEHNGQDNESTHQKNIVKSEHTHLNYPKAFPTTLIQLNYI